MLSVLLIFMSGSNEINLHVLIVYSTGDESETRTEECTLENAKVPRPVTDASPVHGEQNAHQGRSNRLAFLDIKLRAIFRG